MLLLAAYELFALKVTAAGGVPVVAQLYVRFASPPLSAPNTLSVVVVPVTGLGIAAAAVATVGGAFVTEMEIVAILESA